MIHFPSITTHYLLYLYCPGVQVGDLDEMSQAFNVSDACISCIEFHFTELQFNQPLTKQEVAGTWTTSSKVKQRLFLNTTYTNWLGFHFLLKVRNQTELYTDNPCIQVWTQPCSRLHLFQLSSLHASTQVCSKIYSLCLINTLACNAQAHACTCFSFLQRNLQRNI